MKKRAQQKANKKGQRENQRDSGIDSASHISGGTSVASVERADPLSELSTPPQHGTQHCMVAWHRVPHGDNVTAGTLGN